MTKQNVVGKGKLPFGNCNSSKTHSKPSNPPNISNFYKNSKENHAALGNKAFYTNGPSDHEKTISYNPHNFSDIHEKLRPKTTTHAVK